MRNSEFGIRSWNWKRCSGIPHSAFRIPHSRRGVSLLEVLFAILVTTIGLLGALALLPVASSQARKGRINDALGAAATRCIHEFDARGMRRAGNWIAWDPTLATPIKFRLVTLMPASVVPYGTSYCIDPRMIAANELPARAVGARKFPYSATGTEPVMLRCTLRDGGTVVNYMKKLQADSIFFIDDDLTYDRSDDRSLQPTQTYEFLPGASTFRGRRQTDGHLSWMATVVPKLDRYTASFNDTYVLSIVMFYDRPTSFGYNEATTAFDLPDERTLGVTFTGGGVMGGEVLLTSSSATAEADLKIRPNDWIMLSGIATHATAPPPGVPVFKWYRVSDTEAETTDDDGDGTWERYATLMGPDWDTSLSNQRAVYVEGVVGVYEKTIRLEP